MDPTEKRVEGNPWVECGRSADVRGLLAGSPAREQTGFWRKSSERQRLNQMEEKARVCFAPVPPSSLLGDRKGWRRVITKPTQRSAVALNQGLQEALITIISHMVVNTLPAGTIPPKPAA
ncbi:hypothetical protein Cadr_000020060 [Camelus dromedarius]|uniref:Uncharacterized protein n=1 Tax=Camelus dromedarius TaxID=9838 RepID=A0A5N4CYH9_CAMDR|nr:hypothetical protein Cadr_000020060 [Camelus dromedarius]